MSRPAALDIIQRLRAHGHVAYLAGGCVRDRLLGLTPKDHDVATSAPPDVVRQLFTRSQAVGEAFGVVLVYTRAAHADAERNSANGAPGTRTATEVATFRTEGPYSDGRRPDHVAFSDAAHDAQRRDFTVNGLFEDPGELRALDPPAHEPAGCATRTLPDGSVILDHVGGLADLEAKVIRAIGDPARRFAEDYLRLLRAPRFAARLGFAIEPATAAAIRSLAHHLGRVTRERIGQEVRLMLSAPTRALAATMLQGLHLDGPTLEQDHADPPLPRLRALDPTAGYPATLTAWLLDRATPPTPPPAPPPSTAKGLASLPFPRRALNLTNAETESLRRIAAHLGTLAQWDDLPVPQRKRLLSAADADEALKVLATFDPARAEAVRGERQRLAADGVGLAPPPILTGNHLLRLGRRPGPAFKPLLDAAYDAQLLGTFHDEASALAWLHPHLQAHGQ